ncbi:efflux RND transporter periplasmic adaptor subunit [Janthinobacterium sp. 17J80-10]|uniref:efflux RND transporter periplasmic adaptor subunit n=1 Tax=Janthinobacterium sp. 17J80-10 TaxID=2497863 RepID=UPI001005393D|nr:efflux RND transporter periplasmic adaptor subunit [Janthinobacterium sp. 17J80-10]QAU36048.1 efflux RND transporter periplasmic adaptor subunit [Janthinobacterium sp. 17J80-10]
MINPRTVSASRSRLAFIGIVLTVLLGACSKPVPKAEDIRPVRVLKLAAGQVTAVAEFPGEVRPRIESRLGFRVGGKIVARKVDVGASVRRGQVLMQLDPQDLQLAQTQAQAALKAAESNQQLARAELLRYQELRDKNFVSQAVLDSKSTTYQAARASFEQAQAAFRNQSNQAGYASLVADADGVVTAIEAEVGQVVAAGNPVLRLAQLGEKEIVIGIPEDKVDALRRVTDVQVRVWAKPDEVFAGKIREVAPMADPATRTFTARISLAGPSADIKLGMTAYVSFAAASPHPMLKVPLTAVFQNKSESAVWVVENNAVKLVPVRLAGPAGNDVLIAAGLAPGQTVVTAGVNFLRAGQKVRILDEQSQAGSSAVAATSGKATEAAK